MNIFLSLADRLSRIFRRKPLGTYFLVSLRNAIFVVAGAVFTEGNWALVIAMFIIGYVLDDVIERKPSL